MTRVLIPAALTAVVLVGCASQRCRHAGCGTAGVAVVAAAPAPAEPEPRDTSPIEAIPAASPSPPIERPAPPPSPVATPVRTSTPPPALYDHAPDYSWLRGRLQRVHVQGGDWKIRYAPLDVADHWGGSMILALDARVDAFKDGDYVYIEGEILSQRPSVYLSGPLYRVSTIRPAGPPERLAGEPQSVE